MTDASGGFGGRRFVAVIFVIWGMWATQSAKVVARFLDFRR